MDSRPAGLPAPETLFAAVIYLATNYVKTGCPMLAHMIMRQLAYIESHPSGDVAESTRAACSRLRDEWERIGIERAQLLRDIAAARAGDGQPLH